MDPEQWKEVDELLQSLLALPSKDRDEFLHRVDERRKWFDLTGGPESGPLGVAATPQDDGILRSDDFRQVGVHHVIPFGDEFIAVLGDAVEGEQFVDD